MNNESDQWLTDGICAKCRRMRYCKKTCTAQRKRRDQILRQLVREKTSIDVFEKAVGLEAEREKY